MAHTALTQMGKSSRRREGKSAARRGSAAPLAAPDPAAEQARFKALLRPALDEYAGDA